MTALTCGLCPAVLDERTVWTHLEQAHRIVEWPEVWDDGGAVVEDDTLMPADFVGAA